MLDKAGRNSADPDWPGAGEHVGVAGLSIATLNDLDRALAGVDLESVPLFIRSGASRLPVGVLLVALAKKRGANLAKLRGCVEISLLGSAPMGGGFGGKDDTAAIVCARTALAAKLLGRPVKMVYRRDWSMRESYKRHPISSRADVACQVRQLRARCVS